MNDFVDLFHWITVVEPGDFPPAPYKLEPWLTVRSWEKYLNGLRREGREGPMAHTGSLHEHLRRLYKLWNSDRIKKKP